MTDPRTTGATASGAEDKRTLWPWLLLAALIAALLIWWLVAALTDDDDPDTDATTAVEDVTDPVDDEIDTEIETETAAPTSPVPVTVVPVGGILVGDVDLLDPAADPSGLVGEQVEANTVDVASVVADEAFFVGPEQGNTILVRLPEFAGEDSPESPFAVAEGDQVSFTGTLQEIDEEFLDELVLFGGSGEYEIGDYYVAAEDLTLVE